MKNIIDSVVEKVGLVPSSEDKIEMAPITVWIPVTAKAKYDLAQVLTKRRAGKVLKEIVVQSIETITSAIESEAS